MPLTMSMTIAGDDGTITMNNGPEDQYQFGAFKTSGVQWERNTVTSPWVHGRRLRSARKSPKLLTGELYVVSGRGAGVGGHDAALETLLDTLGQFTYTVTISTSAGGSWSYTAEPADVEQAEDESLMVNAFERWTTLHVTIPVRPIPLAGAW